MARLLDFLLGIDRTSSDAPETRSSHQPWVSPSRLDLLGPGSSPYPRMQTDETNLELVAVFRSVTLLSDLVATLPFVAERLDPVDASVPRRDRTWTYLDAQPSIIAAPDPLEAQDETLRRLAAHLALRGNAFIVVTLRDTSTGRPVNAIVPDPDDIRIEWNESRTRPVYRWREQLVPRGDIRHLRFLPVPGRLWGLGPLQAAGRFIGGALAADEFARRLFSDGRLPGGIIEAPVMLSDSEARELKAQFAESNQPLSREPGVLSGGAKWTQTNIRPDEAQFIETRGFGVEQVAAMFGIDPYLLAHQVPGSSLVYRNVAGLFQSLLRTVLEPSYLSKIENAFSTFLPAGQRARFQTDEFLRTDQMERMQTYEIAVRSQVLTPNEARRLEGLPPLPGGDELVRSAPAVELPTETI